MKLRSYQRSDRCDTCRVCNWSHTPTCRSSYRSREDGRFRYISEAAQQKDADHRTPR